MGSSTADSGSVKLNPCPNPCRKVRVIAKIRSFTDQEFDLFNGGSTPYRISKQNPYEGACSSDKVTISLGEQPISRKDLFEVDYCYDQKDDVDTIFSREIKPLISGVFNGRNTSIIAYGARGSGKTYTIQGSEERPGLALLAMAEIFSVAKEIGKSVTVSSYEVFQDHTYDLLDPKHPEVQVLEDAQGKIKLRGLSQVFVESLSEFNKIYFSGFNSRKPTHKIALELPRRSHKGLIIQISSDKENLSSELVGKMNFVDLAGYEDSRRNSSDGINLVESTRINKSLYALINVVYALNANESRVPYRESKLTRILQESLGGTNNVLMLTCLNPFFCQDTIYTISLASRSCQVTNRVLKDSTMKIKSSAKPLVLSSLRNGKPATVSTTVKKQMDSRVHFSEEKASFFLKGRTLFHEENSVGSKQAKFPSKDASAGKSKFLPDITSPECSLQEEEKSISDVSLAIVPKREENLLPSAVEDTKPSTTTEKEALLSAADYAVDPSIPDKENLLPSAIEDTKPSTTIEKEALLSAAYNAPDSSIPDKDVSLHSMANQLEVTPGINSDVKALTVFKDGYSIEKENESLLMNGGGSLSARIKEISNNLKSVYSSTPLCIKMPEDVDTPYSGQVVCTDIAEPKTPVIEQDVRVNDKWEIAKFNSPWETLTKRSSGMKNALVQEYLKFLNTAEKEKLKEIKGIGEKRATYILELREESPEPFKSLEDLHDIGLSAKQIKGMMKSVAGELLS